MNKFLYQRYRQLIPALLLGICCVSTIASAIRAAITADGNTYGFAFSAQHYAAIAFTVLTLASYFLLQKYYRYLLGVCLLLGLLNLLYFTTNQTIVGIGFGELAVSVNLVSLLIILITYGLNFNRANAYLFDLLKPTPAKVSGNLQEDIAQFKERFARKSTEELLQLTKANRLVPAALAAARQLIQERA